MGPGSSYLCWSCILLAMSTVLAADSCDIRTEDSCGLGMYSRVKNPTLDNHHLQDLPGFTRSLFAKDHALLTPESRVWSPLPGWRNSLGAVVITPAIGAHFTMTLIQMAENSTAGPPSLGNERLAFVVEGEVAAGEGSSTPVSLPTNHFMFAPADAPHKITSEKGAFLVVIERKYSQPPVDTSVKPRFLIGNTEAQQTLETPGEVFVLRKLLPTSLEYDFNIHIMDFAPGEYLNVKELHYNQHGLLLLQGKGIYRLADNWYPVQAGDVIWMAPYVPQWYAALGTSKSRYFLYKDTNRDPIHQF